MNIDITKFEEVNNLKSCDSAVYTCYKCGKTETLRKPKLVLRGRLICNSCFRSETQQLMLDPKAAEDRIRAKSTVHVTSIEEAKKIPGCKYISFNCIKCGKLCGNDAERLVKKGLLLCGDCMKKHTNLEKFGYENPMFDPKRKEAASKYNLEHKDEINEARRLSIQASYGVDNVMQVEEHKRACFDSNRANHGGVLAQQTEEQRQLQSERMIANHGFSEQATATNIANHGGVHNLALPENREKLYEYQRTHKQETIDVRNNTNIEVNGKANYMCYGTPEFNALLFSRFLKAYPGIIKARPFLRQALLDNGLSEFDVEDDNRVIEALSKSTTVNWDEINRERYKVMYNATHPCSKPMYLDGMEFDSKWELAYYLYERDVNHSEIKREPVHIPYTDSNGKKHIYTPDFSNNGDLVEIKGGHFYKDKDQNNDLYNPFDDRKETQDNFKALGETIKRNVKVISDNEITKYTNYMNANYDYDWLQSLYLRNLMRFAFSRFTFQPIYCNNMNNGKGVSPFDYDIKNEKYAPITGKGISPFDIMK